jgi:hypothetical protein
MENIKETSSCGFCGGDLRKFSLSPPAEESSAPNDPADEIISLVGSRRSTDRKMTRLWAIIPVGVLSITLGYILQAIRIMSFPYDHWDYDWLDVFYAGSLIVGLPLFGVLFGAMVYKMIKRINLHTRREDALRAATMAYLRTTAGSAEKEQQILTELLRMSAFDGQALAYEKKHKPAQWAAGITLLFLAYPMYFGIIIIAHALIDDPWGSFRISMFFSLFSYGMMLVTLVASAYIVNFFMRTIYTHDFRWNGFTTTTMMVLHRLGKIESNRWEHRPLKERSMIKYAIITILTGGIFLFYWFYALVDDPNKHFEQQHAFEDMLKEVVKADKGSA